MPPTKRTVQVEGNVSASIAAQLNTDAGAGFVQKSHVLLAAPGAGFRYRVTSWSAISWAAFAGVANFPDTILWLEGRGIGFGLGDHWLALTARATDHAAAPLDAYGYVYPVNTALTIGSIGTVPNMGFFASVAYIIDPV